MSLKHRFPHLLPQEAVQDRDSCLSRDVRIISPEILIAAFPKGINLILASPPTPSTQVSNTNKARTPQGPDIGRDIIHLILHLSKSQPDGVGYIWNSSELNPPSPNTMPLLGPGSLLDATKRGLVAYRNTRIWQNLLPQDTLLADHACLQPTTRPVESLPERAGLSHWSTYPTQRPANSQGEQPTPPRGQLPYLGSQRNDAPFRIHKGIPCRGMLYTNDNPDTPPVEVREALMGFRVGDTTGHGLSEAQRVQLLGQCTDLNTLTWTISTIRRQTLLAEQDPHCPSAPTQ
jgi:hypothetical protein